MGLDGKLPFPADFHAAEPALFRRAFDPLGDVLHVAVALFEKEAGLRPSAALAAGLAHSRQPRSTVSSLRFQASKSSLPNSAVSILSRSRWCTSTTSGGTRIGAPSALVLTWISQARCSM